MRKSHATSKNRENKSRKRKTVNESGALAGIQHGPGIVTPAPTLAPHEPHFSFQSFRHNVLVCILALALAFPQRYSCMSIGFLQSWDLMRRIVWNLAKETSLWWDIVEVCFMKRAKYYDFSYGKGNVIFYFLLNYY